MKIFIISALLACLAFPVFSQNARLQSLSDSMGMTISNSHDTLADIDSRMTDNANGKAYSTYMQRYRSLTMALEDSEFIEHFTPCRQEYILEEEKK